MSLKNMVRDDATEQRILNTINYCGVINRPEMLTICRGDEILLQKMVMKLNNDNRVIGWCDGSFTEAWKNAMVE